jgi:AcrR family transcriptional regulator
LPSVSAAEDDDAVEGDGADRVGGAPSLASPEPTRPLTPRGRNTHDRLVTAAGEVFAQKRYDEARITEITARAGVATGSFYTYFASKEALFRVVAERALDDMFRAPRKDPDNADGNPVRDIAYASRSYFEACQRHRLIAQSIELVRGGDEQVRRNRRDTLLRSAKRIERWIRRLQETGICDARIDPWYTALALQAMNVNVAYDQLVHRDDFEKVDALVDAVTPIWARAVGLEAWL